MYVCLSACVCVCVYEELCRCLQICEGRKSVHLRIGMRICAYASMCVCVCVCVCFTSSVFLHPMGIFDLEIENVWVMILLVKSPLHTHTTISHPPSHGEHVTKPSPSSCIRGYSEVSTTYLFLNYW